MPKHQYSLALIPRQVGQSFVDQRSADGYINATALCDVAGKKFYNYVRVEENGRFLNTLASKTGIPYETLIQGDITIEVWVHPKVAVHLAQWLSPDFAVAVSEWVYEWLSGNVSKPAQLPAHLVRYAVNDGKIPIGYFSILQETTLGLVVPLHHMGFEIPSGWVPDISVGLKFCEWLRKEKGVDTDALPKYLHEYQDRRGTQKVKMYPDKFLADYRMWFRTIWLPQYGADYFKRKDPGSMMYFDRLPAISGPKQPANDE